MRYNFIALLMIVVSVCFTSCNKKPQTNDIIATKPVEQKPTGPQKMADNNQSRDVKWIGANYKIVVQRHAVTDLPLVQDESERKYYDNKIDLKILRSDGTEFFSRTFTKSNFNDCLDEDYKKNGALLGIVFDRVDGDKLVFAASVGSPDITSDEYLPMIVTLSKSGSVSIKKDTHLDTGSDEEETDGN
jgi:hypothetical protein